MREKEGERFFGCERKEERDFGKRIGGSLVRQILEW